MLSLVTLLSTLVRKVPKTVIVAVLAITLTLGYFVQFQVLAEGNEGFAPDAPELDAFTEIGELFGDDSSGQVMQVILSAPDGESVLSLDGRAAADEVVAAIEASEISGRLQSQNGQPPIVTFFSPLDGAGTGPSIQVIVRSPDGDVLTPEGVALAADVEAAIGATLSDLLATEGEQPPVVSFALPVSLASGGQGAGNSVTLSLSGPDVISSEGLGVVLAFHDALMGTQVADFLVMDDPFTPPVSSFLLPVIDGIAQGFGSPDMPTDGVKQAYLQGLANMPAEFAPMVEAMLVGEVDPSVPSATAGLISVNFASAPVPQMVDGVGQVAASIPLPDGFELQMLPMEGGEPVPVLDTPEAVKAAYEQGSALLPDEFGRFLAFLFSNDFDSSSLEAASGMVSATLTADPSEEQLDDLDGALSAIDVPAGYGIGYLTSHATDEELVAAYRDRLAFVPAEQAGLLSALLSSDADLDAGSAAHGLMVVFIDSAADTDDEVVLSELQGELNDELMALDLPGGFQARAFSFGLIFSEGSDIQAQVGRMFAIAGMIIVAILLFVYWAKPHGRLSRGGSMRRTLADTSVTLLAIFMAIGWMQGIGVLMGPDYLGWIGYTNQIAQMLPVLLIGLGVDYGIHMTSRYREEAGGGATVDGAIGRATRTVGIALVLATMTTVVGFLTNLVSPVGALKDFGVLAAVGIVSAFVLMLTFVPAIRSLLDRRAERNGTWPAEDLSASRDRLLPKLIGSTSWLARKIPVVTVLVALALGAVGAYGVTQLDTKFSFVDFVPNDSPLLETFTILTEDFGGGFGETTNILVKGDLANPAAHNAAVETWANLSDTPDVLKFGDRAAAEGPLAVIGSMIDPADPAFDEGVAAIADEVGVAEDLTVGPDADVVALYAAAAAADPSAWSAVAYAPSGGNVEAMLWTVSTQSGDDRVKDLRANMNEDVQPLRDSEVEAVVTSDGIIGRVVVESLQDSQVSSLALTIAISALILVINFMIESRRPALGLITIAPVALVVLWTFGMMALTGIPFGPVTATISALAIGIGVPYTIHITHRFLEDRLEEPTTEAAVHSTAVHTGGALAGSAFTTMAGFGSLVTSNLTPFRQFGAVTFYAIAFALLASVLVLPSMLVLWDRWHRKRGDATLDEGAVHRVIDAATEVAASGEPSIVGDSDPFS